MMYYVEWMDDLGSTTIKECKTYKEAQKELANVAKCLIDEWMDDSYGERDENASFTINWYVGDDGFEYIERYSDGYKVRYEYLIEIY